MQSLMRTACLAAVAVFAFAAGARQDGVILKRIAKVGDTIKYRMKADLDLKGSTVSLTSLITEKVTKVADDGTYTIDSKTTEGKVAYQGETTPQADGATTVTFKANGQLVLYIAEQDDPNIYRMVNLQSLHFSPNPVKVGDSWNVTIPKDDRGSVDASGTCKVEAQEQVLGHDTLRIHVILKESIDKDPASVDATYWVDPKDGSVVELTGTWTNAPWPSPVGPATAKVTLMREGG